MPIIGVKEFKEKTSRVVRDLVKKQKKFILTSRGRPVAKILPISEDELEDFFFSSANVPLMKLLEEREKEPSVPLDKLIKRRK